MTALDSTAPISRGKLMWQMTRPHTLTATFVPVILGTVMALFETSIHWGLFIAMMAAGLCLQIATNLFNEYYDFKKGLDTADSVGIGGGIVRHGLKPSMVLSVALILYVIAGFIGIYIAASTSFWLIAIGVVGMAVGYFYTGGPLPIAYTPLGELFAGVFMGIGFILIAYYLQTLEVTMWAFLLSFPFGILVGAINMSNNIRDIQEDTIGGRKTLPILLGRERAITGLAVAFVVSYVWIIALVVLQIVTPWALLVLLAVPKSIKAIKSFRLGKTKPAMMGPAMKSTALTNTFVGILLTIGLFIDWLL
ncbi:1,4-dihydroxy-2-naphthoate polyprenyltransferase [Chryseomicrobium sp. FSL W7-1435]|uniref:1,4-dihydroxy-2-naphthoate polyprenyltransferase n=1 Tax=Chryseomicrobium sp. FSL W7-1435 TaxID=2921704 RepID=UPI003159D4CE